MPIYGYACTNCGHTLDVLQKMADAPLVDCPECDEPQLKRQLSAPRFRLKGKGWYETDFKSDKQRNLAGEKDDTKADKAAGDAKGGDKGTTESTADVKAAAKADGKAADAKVGDKAGEKKPAVKKADRKASNDKRGAA